MVSYNGSMKCVRIRNVSRGGAELAQRAEVARGFWRRLRGLMGRPGLPAGGGLVIRPCNSVHSLFMRFPIEVVHAGRDGTVLRVLAPLRPWRLGPLVRGSHLVVELPVGTVAATGTQPGDRLAFEAVE